MIKNAEELLSYFLGIFPKFKARWESENNYNVFDDNSFSTAGLCAEFSQYYIDEFDSIDQKQKEELFRSIENVLLKSELDGDFLELADSLKSCFLENISQTEAGELSKVYMGDSTRRFFDGWHVYP